MSTIQAQIWNGSPFTVERKEGRTPGTVIFRLCGPLTAFDMYGSVPPVGLREMLDFQRAPTDEAPSVTIPAVTILDLTDVPYMDSTGLGAIVSLYVRCRGKGIRLIAAGAGPRVLELFQMTKVDAVIPMIATVEEADTH